MHLHPGRLRDWHFGLFEPYLCSRGGTTKTALNPRIYGILRAMQFLTVLRIFAYIMFLFVPSIAVLLFFSFVVRDADYFTWLGLGSLLANGIFVLLPPVKARIGKHIRKIGGGV